MSGFAQRLLVSSPAVIFTCKAGGDDGATYISDNFQPLLGYQPEDILNNSAFWKDHI